MEPRPSTAHHTESFLYSRWLPPMLRASIKFYQLTFGRLPHFSLQIELTVDGVPKMLAPHSALAFYSYLTVMVIYCQMLFLTLLHKLLLPHDAYTWNDSLGVLRLAIAVYSLLFAMMASLLSRVLLHTNELLVSYAVNYVLSLNPRPLQRSTQQMDMAGFLLLYFTVGIISLGTPLAFLLWIYQLDTCNYAANELFGSYVSAYPLIASILTFSFNIWLFITILRDACVVAILGMFLGVASTTILNDLLNKLEWSPAKSQLLLQEYKKMWLIARTAEDGYNQFIFLVLAIGQIVITAFAWIVVRAYHVVPTLVVLIFVVAFVGGILILDFCLKLGISIRQQSKTLINSNKKLLKTTNSRRNSLVYEWAAQKPLPIKCGSRFHFTKDASAKYMEVLFTNITNAVLLIDI